MAAFPSDGVSAGAISVYGLLPQDFTVSATPSFQTVKVGSSTTYTVNTSALSGFSGSIGLSVSGLPANATGTFSPASVSAGGSSTLTVTTASNIPTGGFTLTITGTSGTLTHSAAVTLTVKRH
jgi:hypothetical protein